MTTNTIAREGPPLPPAPVPVTPAPSPAAAPHTYGQILKSSALIGGSSVLNIAIGVVRTKAMALLLGPGGVGLLGLYGSIADLAQSIAGMGVNSSGVRQIAEAVGTGDTGRIARTVAVLRRISILLGLLGGGLLILFSGPVSTLTFGTSQNAVPVALLSVAVFLRCVSAGQGALLQGMRRISDLAIMGVLGALLGTAVSIPLVYFLGERGVVPCILAVAVMTILASWWYSRRIQVPFAAMTSVQFRQETGSLLKLGFAFMASGFLTMGAAYVIRIMVLRGINLEAAGLYQSAWTLGGLYVGFILQAMGTDFYPRLTAVCRDNAACNRLVNEQALISMLLAGPGVLATLTFAPLVIALFYSTRFSGAVDILRWICLGMTLRVVSWPMGFIVLAKGWQKIFFWTEVAATLVHVGLAWLCIPRFGLTGAGVAFFGLYVWHGFLIYAVVHWMSGFRWSAANRKVGLLSLPLVAIVFGSCYLLPFWVATAIGIVAVVLSSVCSLRVLLHLVSLERIPAPIRRLLVRFRVAPRHESPPNEGNKS